MRFQYNPAVEEALRKDPTVKKALRDVGEEIADQTAARAVMFGSGRRYGPIEVNDDTDGIQVAATGPFAHIDEWGSANSAATAAMRSAAAAAGRFEEQ